MGLLQPLIPLGFIISLCMSLPAPMIAQGPGQPPSSVINGRLNPDRIPDLVAWRMLTHLLADGRNSLSWGQRLAHLRTSGLPDGEIGMVISAATRATIQTSQGEASLRDETLPLEQRTAALRQARDHVLNEEWRRLEQTLPRESFLRLRDYLRTKVKPNIVMSADEEE